MLNKTIMYMTITLAGIICSGGELDVKGSFAETGENGLPAGWVQHGWEGYKPFAKLKVISGESAGDKALLISDNNAQYGTCVRNVKRFPVKAGDKISISLKSKGAGTAWTGIYTYSADGQWTGVCPEELFPLSDNWKTRQVEITVPDGKKSPTGFCEIVFGAKKGAEAAFSDIKVMQESSLYSGALAFPRAWTVFAPTDRNFKPSPEQISSVPKEFSGAKSLSVQMVGDELDLAPIFGGQKEGNSAWIFAELEAPFDCDYSIGAGADWWMEYYVNGVKVIDTMTSGNQKTPYQINNHIATVKLKKGRNILTVKFVSGSASSVLKMGGPDELRALKAKLEITRTDCADNYDAPGARPGNPGLIQGYPTPGLLAITGQGVYHANPEVSICFPDRTFTLPTVLSGNLFATGLRIQSFGQQLRVGSSLSFDIAAAESDGTVFSLRFDHLKSSDTLTVSVQETSVGKSTVIRQIMLPFTSLPADVMVAVNQGNYVINISSLSDSSFRSINGESALLVRFGDKPVKTAGVFRSSTKEPAEIVVDNYFIGEAGSLIKSARIPFKIERNETFDPVKSNWKLVFNDEFDGTAIDWDNKWREYKNKEYSKDFASLDGKGHLLIKTDFGPDGKTLMTSALWSQKTFRYGYFESRLRFTKQPGWWAGFWLYGPSNSNPMLDGFEIDIFEDYYTRAKNENGPNEGILDHNLHIYNGGLLKSWNYKSQLPGGIDDFYTLGVKWTPFEISYYLNGKLIKSSANHSPYDSVTFDAVNHCFGGTPLYTILSGQIGGQTSEYAKNPKNGTFPEYFMVDYVRVYEYPENKAPKVSWTHVPASEIVVPGETIVLEAAAEESALGGSKISRAYLFDNGYIIDYKEKPPYRFEFAIDKKHYDNTPYTAPGRQGVKLPLDGCTHAFCVAVQDQSGMVGYSPVHTIIPAAEGSKPYQGKAQVIPGTIKVGYYDEGGNNVAYYDTTAKNLASTSFRPGESVDASENGIGSVASGEWIKYSVDITKAGKYDIAVPYGSPVYGGTSRIRLLLDGRLVGEIKLDKRTASWSPTPGDPKAELKGVVLPAGRHTLTLLLIGGFNMANLEFTPVAGTSETGN